MLSDFLSLIDTGQLTEVERIKLPRKSERREAVPKAFQQGVVGRWLSTSPELRRGLWTHQASALEHVAAAKNVVVATGTASGKSLIFQAAAFWLLGQKPETTVLVFYPLKALVADQFISWKNIASVCGFPDDIVARLDGDVDPDERQRIIEKAHIILATPDVIHAWLMAKLAQPAHKRFLSKLGLQQAIREAYPGALYLHLAKGWKVQEWRATSFERAIRVSLRLSEPLFDKLDLLVGRLRKAVDMTPEKSDILTEDLVAKIEEWQLSLSSDDTETFLSLLGAKQSADGWLQVYSPGSIVAKRDAQNILRDIEIVGTELVAIDGPSRLFYRYRAKNNVTALVSSDSVEAVGDLWSMSYWNPATGEYKEVVDDLVIPRDRPVSLEDSASPTEQSS
jgi:hypothetical protein